MGELKEKKEDESTTDANATTNSFYEPLKSDLEKLFSDLCYERGGQKIIFSVLLF